MRLVVLAAWEEAVEVEGVPMQNRRVRGDAAKVA